MIILHIFTFNVKHRPSENILLLMWMAVDLSVFIDAIKNELKK